MQQTARKL